MLGATETVTTALRSEESESSFAGAGILLATTSPLFQGTIGDRPPDRHLDGVIGIEAGIVDQGQRGRSRDDGN